MQGSLIARFMSKVRVPTDDPQQCWEWVGFIMPTGHGQMREGLAHRVGYELLVGPIPEGLTIDHECHNLAYSRGECDGGRDCPHRRCVNPWHLNPKTMIENARAGAGDHSTKEFCRNGHPNAEFRRVTPSGHTYCQKCRAEYKVRYNMMVREYRERDRQSTIRKSR